MNWLRGPSQKLQDERLECGRGVRLVGGGGGGGGSGLLGLLVGRDLYWVRQGAFFAESDLATDLEGKMWQLGSKSS